MRSVTELGSSFQPTPRLTHPSLNCNMLLSILTVEALLRCRSLVWPTDRLLRFPTQLTPLQALKHLALMGCLGHCRWGAVGTQPQRKMDLLGEEKAMFCVSALNSLQLRNLVTSWCCLQPAGSPPCFARFQSLCSTATPPPTTRARSRSAQATRAWLSLGTCVKKT